MKLSKKIVFLTAALSVSSIAYADVPVVDAYDDSSSSVQSNPAPSSSSTTTVVKENNQTIKVTPVADDDSSSSSSVAAPSDNSAMSMKDRVTILEKQVQNLTKMLNQYNTLQTQMQDMHGQLELQKHAIKVLQTQMKSQYQDLDQRLGSTTPKATQTPDSGATPSTTAPTDEIPAVSSDKPAALQASAAAPAVASAPAATPTNSADQASYDAAFNLLKNKNYAQATAAFQKFVKEYPAAQNTTNARYWLGQLYLLQGQPDKAITQFRVILKTNPTHAKVPDTLLQLGLAYYAKGDLVHARMEFNRVQQKYPTTNAAKLAQNHLQQMSPSATVTPAATTSAPAASTTE